MEFGAVDLVVRRITTILVAVTGFAPEKRLLTTKHHID